MKDAPLREGLLLVGGLACLAWPLSMMTGKPAPVPSRLVVAQVVAGDWVTDVQVKAAHEFTWMELRRGEEVLGRVQGPTREGEFECLLAEQGEDLIVAAEFDDDTPETALQVQLWPASLPEVELNFWAEGDLLEEVTIQFYE